MDPRSQQTRRAGAKYALLSALFVACLALFAVPAFAASAVSLELTAASLAVPVASPGDTTGNGYVTVGITPDPPCQGPLLSLAFTACRCNVDPLIASFGPTGIPRIRAVVRPDVLCAVCDPHTVTLPLGTMNAGHYSLYYERTLVFVRADSTVDSTTTLELVSFDVLGECPGPTGVRYLNQVHVGGASPCVGCPPETCANEKIPLLLRGTFPDACTWVDTVRFIPSPVAGPMPVPPIVEIVYKRSCQPAACPAVVVPWERRLFLPPLPPNFYDLHVRGVIETDCGSLPEPAGEGSFVFSVVQCSTQVNCYRAFFPHTNESCDASFSGAKPAEVTLNVASRIPIAGLQGVLRVDAPALEIVDVFPASGAAGMSLQWTREGNGARFVLFSTNGTTIGGPEPNDAVLPHPVLTVKVAINPLVDAPIPAVAFVSADELIASDSEGHALPRCPVITLDLLSDPRARICAATVCDHNGDGQADVRDLVLLVRCIQGLAQCTDPLGMLDCDHDGALDLDDVFCCARVVLGGAPDDSVGGRPEPRVTLRIDPPIVGEDGVIDVPVRLDGTAYVGAARLELSYPSSRYEIVELQQPSGSNWLALTETRTDRIVLGLIGVAGDAPVVVGQEAWHVRLRLRAGQSPGGALALESAQFSGGDGVGLVTGVVPQSVSLGSVGVVALSTPRPNPFGDRTEFTVNLAAPTALEVEVFDLAGRRVATVFRGVAPAGVNDYAWRGMRDDGSRARSGVYFVRVRSNGSETGRKVLFVPSD
jgi:hypothetical protein